MYASGIFVIAITNGLALWKLRRYLLVGLLELEVAGRGTDTRERILDTAQSLILEKGFAATSLDDVIRTAGLTKGAFFHHFRSKSDLARKLVERFAAFDFKLFDEWTQRAETLADSPYQAVVIFIKLFEEWLSSLPTPFAGCLFAVYVYESDAFDADINAFVRTSLERWQGYYERLFTALLAVQRPKIDVTARELAEQYVSTMEGAFILARAYKEPELIVRQSRLFREWLKLAFEAA
jgi:TetR/AcrR family transcriptional repressor of nem operon